MGKAAALTFLHLRSRSARSGGGATSDLTPGPDMSTPSEAVWRRRGWRRVCLEGRPIGPCPLPGYDE